uniref:G domain-containing protein n=1 Tax=Strongyloides stercoralis TaxID=6248 RepID=A0A0K0DWS7_STRER
MIEEKEKIDCHCHTIRILDHECICCGEKIKKGKILLFDKSKLESEIILSDTVKSQVKKFENILSSNSNLIKNEHSFNNKSYENFTKSSDINNTHTENHFIEKVVENEHVSIESFKYTTNIHESNSKLDNYDLVVKKRDSFNSNNSTKNNYLIDSKDDKDIKNVIHDNFDCRNNFKNDIKTILSFKENTEESKNVYDNLSINNETQEYNTFKSMNNNQKLYCSNKSLSPSVVSNSTLKSNKSFPVPIPPARTFNSNKTFTESVIENSNVTYLKKIEENNNNIENFNKNNYQQNQYFIKKSINEEIDNEYFESSEISKHEKNVINDAVKLNNSSQNIILEKDAFNEYKNKTIELDNLTRGVHNDVILLSKKTKLLEKLSKSLNNSTIDLSKDNHIDLKCSKENNTSLEKDLYNLDVETSNHITKSTTYYETKNNFEINDSKISSKNPKSSISSSSDFISSLKGEVLDNKEISKHLIEITEDKHNLTSELINRTKDNSEKMFNQQNYEETFSFNYKPSNNDKINNNNNLQKSNSAIYYHSTKSSLFDPVTYGEFSKDENSIKSIKDLRNINDNCSIVNDINCKDTSNSYIYGYECEKNVDKLKYWKDKLVQESVIDETYEDLTLYKPKMVSSICPITNTKKVIIGGDSKTNKCKRIILFGLPNSGKTSIVNRICNYLYGTDRSTLLRLVVKFPSELHQKQHEIITYQFNNSLLPYNFIIIDTPGCSGDDNGGQFTYKQLYHSYLKPLVNSQHFFTIDAVLVCLRLNSNCFSKTFNHQIKGLKKIINGQTDSNNILSIFTDCNDKYQINALNDFHKRQISKHHGLFLIHSKSYLNAKHGFSHLDYIRIFEQSESELFKLFMFLEFEVTPTKLVKNNRSEILV